jgi:D-glycero-alpha-D-manno-heptose-7-phosphate kinase
MIIAQTPFRISFFGGGTDYPAYFEECGGAVLGTAIDKSCFISVMHFYSRLFDYSIRIAYRQVECVRSLEDIQHAPFRECLRWCGITGDVEINYTGELPSYSGLGSSSSFVVGLLNALHAFRSTNVSPMDLATQAIDLEQRVLKEAVGCQDQVFAAVGGFNVLEFHRSGEIQVHPVALPPTRLEELEKHLLILHTGIRRRAADIAEKQIRNVSQNRARLDEMRVLVDEGYRILTGNCSIASFGELLDRAWCLKSGIGPAISNDQIRSTYETGRQAGALGGKLLGAGGGGCMLFFVPPEKRESVRSSLPDLEEIPVSLNARGSHIIHA